jgi:hypothetical protein
MIPDAVGLTYNTGIYGLLGNGDGTFASNQVTNTAPSGVLRIGTGDFNCDDAPDLAISDGLGSFVVDRGSPGGSFSSAGGQTFAMDGINRGVVVGDVDDDGLDDIVVAHHTSAGVLQLFVYRNTSGDP